MFRYQCTCRAGCHVAPAYAHTRVVAARLYRFVRDVNRISIMLDAQDPATFSVFFFKLQRTLIEKVYTRGTRRPHIIKRRN